MLQSSWPEDGRRLLASIEDILRDAEYQLERLSSAQITLALAHDLSTELRTDLVHVERETEELRVIGEVEDNPGVAVEIGQRCAELQMRLRGLRLEARAAILRAQEKAERNAKLADRTELFARAAKTQGSEVALRDLKEEDKLMNATSSVTEALRRTHRLLSTEVEKSILSREALEDQSSILRRTNEAYGSFGELMDASKQLIRALERADWLDRALIIAALVLFLLVLAYILKRRILDRGLSVVYFFGRWIPGLGSVKSVLRRGPQRAIKAAEQASLATQSAASTSTIMVSTGHDEL